MRSSPAHAYFSGDDFRSPSLRLRPGPKADVVSDQPCGKTACAGRAPTAGRGLNRAPFCKVSGVLDGSMCSAPSSPVRGISDIHAPAPSINMKKTNVADQMCTVAMAMIAPMKENVRALRCAWIDSEAGRACISAVNTAETVAANKTNPGMLWRSARMRPDIFHVIGEDQHSHVGRSRVEGQVADEDLIGVRFEMRSTTT